MRPSRDCFIAALLVCCVVSVAIAKSISIDAGGLWGARADSVYRPYTAESDDLQAAATGHHYGRVQIKVYRGPDSHGGEHHEHFAPHGYWVKQPADADHHH